jgi:hypothetical protein
MAHRFTCCRTAKYPLLGHLRRNEAVGTVSGVPPIASEKFVRCIVALSRRGVLIEPANQ